MSTEDDVKPSVSDRLQEMLDRHSELNNRYQIIFIASGILAICCAVGFGLTVSTTFATLFIGATFLSLGLLGLSLSRGAGYHARQGEILRSMLYKVRGMEANFKNLRDFAKFHLEFPMKQESVEDVLGIAARNMDRVFQEEIRVLQGGEGLPQLEEGEDPEAFMRRFADFREKTRQDIESRKVSAKAKYNELRDLLTRLNYRVPKSYKELLVEKFRGIHLEN